MTKEEFFDRLEFDVLEEKQWASFYVDMKGISYHLKVACHIGLDINGGNKVRWSKVANLVGYDKKLRYVIYKYTATLEEYIRAYISNKYESISNQEFWIDQEFWRQGERTYLQLELEKGDNISDILEETDLGFLLKQVKALPIEDKQLLFENNVALNKNLNALRELRNAVSHHVFLQEHNFKYCVVNGVDDKSLTHQIKNLRQLLPKEYRFGRNEGGFTAEINQCRIKNQVFDEYYNLLEIDSKDLIILD